LETKICIACMKSKCVDMFNVKVNLFDGVVVTCVVSKTGYSLRDE